jgi:hypothetical protein
MRVTIWQSISGFLDPHMAIPGRSALSDQSRTSVAEMVRSSPAAYLRGFPDAAAAGEE